MPSCTTDQHECILDDQGTKWRPLILQYRENGGIPLDQYDCIFDSQTPPCSYGADPPLAGRDYINLNNFDGYQIDGKYHMKMIWSLGESIEWKQEESIFLVRQQQTVTDVIGLNHKGHTDMMFTGMTVSDYGQRQIFHMFDGSTDQPVTAVWFESQTGCGNQGTNWRTYASVIWENDYHYDKEQWYSTWLSTQDTVDVPFDGTGFLGNGADIPEEDWCMSKQKYYEMNRRGHDNKFIGVYIEDQNCGTTTQTFPAFVRCSGPGAIIPEDGSSCSCADGSTWNTATSACECNAGYVETPYVEWRRNPLCVACTGVGASGKIILYIIWSSPKAGQLSWLERRANNANVAGSIPVLANLLCNHFKVDHYGNCSCGIGAELINGSECTCPDDLLIDSSGTVCYDGIDSTFDQTQFSCETDETDALLGMLGYKFGLHNPERFGVDCDTFGYPVMQVDYIGDNVQGASSGIQPALQPPNWPNDGVMSASISYEVYLPADFEFIQNQFLPGFYHDAPSGYRLTRIKMSNANLQMHTNDCDFCAEANAGGSLGTMTTGVWHKIEFRVKLNDLGASNGEFLFFFDDQLTSHVTGMSLMIPDNSFAITHSRFWVHNNWPGTVNGGSVYFKNYYVSKFSSETTPNAFTTAEPIEAGPTTHPITTTTQPGI